MSLVFFADRQLGRQFPRILREAGLNIEEHDAHFEQNCQDHVWLYEVGMRGWIALSHDRRIRYRPNEQDAVMRAGLGLFIIIGAAPFPVLARHLVPTLDKIRRFVERTPRPFIAKVYRASPAILENNPNSAGDIVLWMTRKDWRPREL